MKIRGSNSTQGPRSSDNMKTIPSEGVKTVPSNNTQKPTSADSAKTADHTRPASAQEIASATCGHPAFDQFVATIAALRAPDGCPWDKVQTHESIAHNMIEEAYEALDCIEAHDTAHLREELGDVLLQVVLHAQIAKEAHEFDIDDVCAEVDDKIVRRHPHVFGTQTTDGEDTAADDDGRLETTDKEMVPIDKAGEVLDRWDKIKLQESKDKGETGLLDGIPHSLPALMQAQKISRKAVSAGFEWATLDDVWCQVEEETAEFKGAYRGLPKEENGKLDRSGDVDKALFDAVEMELGDVLFSLVNVARYLGLDAESALRASCSKFRRRWAHMEAAAQDAGTDLQKLSTPEMEQLWQKAKSTVG